MKNNLDLIYDKFSGKSKELMLLQYNNFLSAKDSGYLCKHSYNVLDNVFLKKGTLLHGTYKNIDGLREIAKNGLISSEFINGRISKYPSCVGVWNLQKDCYLKDYINFYSGATIKYSGILCDDEIVSESKTDVIPYNEMSNINEILSSSVYRMWFMEQTKEIRFMPSYVQNNVQIAIIFDCCNDYISRLLELDVLNPQCVDDLSVKAFVNPNYYEAFIVDRYRKDDFFTNRESAIMYGIPGNFIQGILVGRDYENNEEILNEIKKIVPNAYICNLDGIVIRC